jgi:hypothetical protein
MVRQTNSTARHIEGRGVVMNEAEAFLIDTRLGSLTAAGAPCQQVCCAQQEGYNYYFPRRVQITTIIVVVITQLSVSEIRNRRLHLVKVLRGVVTVSYILIRNPTTWGALEKLLW